MTVFAQDPLSGRDLSTLKVETLTDNQISAIQQKLKQSNMTIDQVESQAISKGMSPSEFTKLKDRVNGISGIVVAKSNKSRTNISEKSSTCKMLKEEFVKEFLTFSPNNFILIYLVIGNGCQFTFNIIFFIR
jgi:hypothetical protein